ncbi:hypothetical protein BDQ12DRAFT_670122 [Crucibulum laeve]|uniref:Uncharacterized protein n=1 Tax=Crucibulum laeve TaxID=68775 RepID=A0A5C3LLM8_9AGAR|nr:hypothetical protein BDQ12DRAFT_670122 [Crucibulum laeve]
MSNPNSTTGEESSLTLILESSSTTAEETFPTLPQESSSTTEEETSYSTALVIPGDEAHAFADAHNVTITNVIVDNVAGKKINYAGLTSEEIIAQKRADAEEKRRDFEMRIKYRINPDRKIARLFPNAQGVTLSGANLSNVAGGIEEFVTASGSRMDPSPSFSTVGNTNPIGKTEFLYGPFSHVTD